MRGKKPDFLPPEGDSLLRRRRWNYASNTPLQRAEEFGEREILTAEELATRYPDRLVLYDLPPLLASDDCLVTLPLVDAALLVVKEGETRIGEIQRCLKLLEDSNLIGTVLNECKETNLYPYY